MMSCFDKLSMKAWFSGRILMLSLSKHEPAMMPHEPCGT